MKKYTEKEDVVAAYNELLPWEKVEVLGDLMETAGTSAYDIVEGFFEDGEDYVYDHIDAAEVVNHYTAETLLDEMSDDEISDYVERHPSTLTPRQLTEILYDKIEIYDDARSFSNRDIERLEKVLKEIKEQNNIE